MVTVGEVVSGVVTETLLKMEVHRVPLLWLVTARPTYTVLPIESVTVLPTCVHVTPSEER